MQKIQTISGGSTPTMMPPPQRALSSSSSAAAAAASSAQQRQHQHQQQQQQQPGCCGLLGGMRRSPPRPPQEIYFESRGKCCKKLLRFNGYPNKVLLYPEEGWARNASSSYWTITPCRWWRRWCIVEEISGSRQTSTYGRMITADDSTGALLIVGSFKKRFPDPDFKLYLSSNVSMVDYNMGYCLTGTLERGCGQSNQFQITHFAVIRRKWPTLDDIKY